MIGAAKKPDQVWWEKWVGWTPRQQQAEAAYREHRHTLYGGAAGGGKSYWLRWAPVGDLIKWFLLYGLRHVRVALFCESYPALHDRHVTRLQVEVPPSLGKYHEQTHELRLHPRYGSGVLCLRNLDDPSKYLSAEFASVAFDELTQVQEQQYDFIQTRIRWPGLPSAEYGTRSGTNPGGPGHGWVRRRWLDRVFMENEREADYAFVPARASDNPHLPAGYHASLDHLPETMRAAYRDGSWEQFEGQVFREWNPSVHVVKPFDISPQWPRFRAVDYGFAAPSAVGWFAQDAADPRRVYLYRELYERGKGPAELAEAIASLTPGGEQIVSTIADPSLFRKNEQTRRTNAEEMGRNGVHCRPGHNDRLSGWRRLHDYLRVEGEGPFLKVFTICPHTIRTLPALVYSKTRSEDVDTQAEDHCADMIRYFLMSRESMKVTTPLPDEEVPDPRPARSWDRIVEEWERDLQEELAAMGYYDPGFYPDF
jgi:phage terminase large subunit